MQTRLQGQEPQFYDQILDSWQTYAGEEKDMTVWCSRSIISVLAEDRKRTNKKEANWNKIMANSLILILALGDSKAIDPRGGEELGLLQKKRKQQYLQDLAVHFHEKI